MCVKHPIFLRKKEGWSREILITIEKEKKIQEKRVVFCSRLYALLILDAGIAHGTTDWPCFTSTRYSGRPSRGGRTFTVYPWRNPNRHRTKHWHAELHKSKLHVNKLSKARRPSCKPHLKPKIPQLFSRHTTLQIHLTSFMVFQPQTVSWNEIVSYLRWYDNLSRYVHHLLCKLLYTVNLYYIHLHFLTCIYTLNSHSYLPLMYCPIFNTNCWDFEISPSIIFTNVKKSTISTRSEIRS